ncbi:tetraspanin-15 [Quercus suber]|uniref:Tetraspanin-15 n=1 Tax=Quercus suber TaxID=58331 RepID=A0AAW0L7H2_QUESU
MTGKATQAKLWKRLSTIPTLILSLPILASVIWLLYMRDYDCEIVLRLPQNCNLVLAELLVVMVLCYVHCGACPHWGLKQGKSYNMRLTNVAEIEGS